MLLVSNSINEVIEPIEIASLNVGFITLKLLGAGTERM